MSSLNVERLVLHFESTSGLAEVRGAPRVIDDLQHRLETLCRQTSRRASMWLPVAVRRDERCLVALAGAAMCAAPALFTPHGPLRRIGAPHTAALRSYQREAVDAALEATCGRGIIEAPTGSGKTRVACTIAAEAGGTWLYLAPSRMLAEQTALEAPANMCCRSFEMVSDDELAQAHGILVDEAHRLAAQSFSRILLRSMARWRLGMSATPLMRQDARNALVVGLLGPVVYSIGLRTLTDSGALARSVVRHVVVQKSNS